MKWVPHNIKFLFHTGFYKPKTTLKIADEQHGLCCYQPLKSITISEGRGIAVEKENLARFAVNGQV